jgi:uncharacterized protein (UPF0261 family)
MSISRAKGLKQPSLGLIILEKAAATYIGPVKRQNVLRFHCCKPKLTYIILGITSPCIGEYKIFTH